LKRIQRGEMKGDMRWIRTGFYSEKHLGIESPVTQEVTHLDRVVAGLAVIY
jgi:hypothetical protein